MNSNQKIEESLIDEVIDYYNTHIIERRKKIEDFFSKNGISLNFKYEEKFSDSRNKLFSDVYKSNISTEDFEELLLEISYD